MFGTLVLLNVISAATVVSNTMLLVVDQRRPLIGRARALGATRSEIASQVRLTGAVLCAASALPAAALAWLAAAAFNATNVLHIWLEIGPPLVGLAAGLLGLAGLFGSWLPARAAASIDPWVVLREPPAARRSLTPQLLVIAVSFGLALLLVGLGSGAREATLEKFRALPIVEQTSFERLNGKVDQAMSSFRLILLVLPIFNCLSVVGSTVHLAAHRERQRLAIDRALGMPRRSLEGRIVGQSLRLCLLAWLLAAPLAQTIALGLGASVLPFPATVPVGGLLLTLGSSGLIGLGGAIGPARTVLRAEPAELLRGAA
jgi:ABC-type antimicrobial peptide transport system permease subunit